MTDKRKIIVLTGHGAWNTKVTNKPTYTKLPAKCSMHFYTNNFTLMTGALGDELDNGKFGEYSPSQTADPFMSAPNMVLTWPRGLTIPAAPTGWASVAYEKGVTIPVDSRNIQFQLKKPEAPLDDMLVDPLGHMYVEDIFTVLEPAIKQASSVLIVWSACRQVLLKENVQSATPKKRIVVDTQSIKYFVDDLNDLAIAANLPPLNKNDIEWHLKLLQNRFMNEDDIIEELEKFVDIDKIIQSHKKPEDALKELKISIFEDLLTKDNSTIQNLRKAGINVGKSVNKKGKEEFQF